MQANENASMTFKPDLSIGEVLTLVVAGIALIPMIRAWYTRRWPMKVRHITASGDRRCIRLGVGTNEVALRLTTRRSRVLDRFAVSYDGSHWTGIDDAVDGVVGMGSPKVLPQGTVMGGMLPTGNGWVIGRSSPLRCDAGASMMIGFSLGVKRPWRGRIRVRFIAEGEADHTAAIRVIVR